MRTTIRFNFIEEKAQTSNEKMVRNYLALPHNPITDNLRGNIIMQDDFEITANDFRKLLKEKDVKTIEDLYAGLGFKKYEIYRLHYWH